MEMAEHVFENLSPEFPKQRQPGDIVIAGRNFGCSSGRALAVKALQATGIGCVVAELFSRTFYRNAAEIGLPILEAPGIHEFAETGHQLRVNVKTGLVENLTSGKSLQGSPPSEFMLDMVEAGGLIPLLKAGKFFERYGGQR
jgi:3-isopropylmalate/(R)-2-methylmalate dehydratase small subunit